MKPRFLSIVLVLCILLSGLGISRAQANVLCHTVLSMSGPLQAAAGTDVAYDVSAVVTAGPLTNVDVTDYLPAGTVFVSATPSAGGTCAAPSGGKVTCNWPGTSVEGTVRSVTVVVTIPADTPMTTTSVTNTADSTSDNGAPAATFTTDVLFDAALTLGKTASDTAVHTRTPLSYTLSAANTGPSYAWNVTLTDDLPAGFVYADAAGDGWTCAYDSGLHRVTCTRPSLGLGAAPGVTVSGFAGDVEGPLSNQASVAADDAAAALSGLVETLVSAYKFFLPLVFGP